ncbi:FxsA family protein [Plantactinospora sp. KBS50]|uniref:FxsA family protein n=1 Tax=Plantactinospora sp. KBS50 TaxID=2024580 RepID=UPI000BAB1602|nr:FxsA family protein [Plantactinospora sp. KBS50]ASW55080.1 exlusion protein FxsA [Plantactinospora sp. KBS50]
MSRWLRFLPLALLIAAVVEIAVFVLLGHLIGYGWTLLLVLAASVAGLFLLRREGLRAWRSFRAAAAAGQPPGRQITEGLVGLAAGLLLAAPGLVSGLLGVLLVVPAVRRGARLVVQRGAERRVSSMLAGEMFGPRRVRVYRGAPRPSGQPPAEPAGPGAPFGPGGPVDGPPSGPSTAVPGAPVPPARDGGGGTDGEIVEGEIVDR